LRFFYVQKTQYDFIVLEDDGHKKDNDQLAFYY
jgi:hypothetical protein